MDFEKFNKIPRLGSKKDQMVITEKIDGTNAQIVITPNGRVLSGSRNRWVTPGKSTDNYGFAQWCAEHREELFKLGVGRHYGEWWGQGIQRRYNADAKHFSIFNTSRPVDSLPDCVRRVPILYHGAFNTDTIHLIFEELWDTGSLLCNEWFKPEGIIVYQFTARQMFKMTFEHIEGKWSSK